MKVDKRNMRPLAALLTTLAFLVPAITFAGVGPGSGSSPGAVPGDDVGTSPIVSGPSTPGYVLVGSLTELQIVLQNSTGSGKVSVTEISTGVFQATFAGRHVIRLSAQSLAQGTIQFDYVGDRDDTRVLTRASGLILLQR